MITRGYQARFNRETQLGEKTILLPPSFSLSLSLCRISSHHRLATWRSDHQISSERRQKEEEEEEKDEEKGKGEEEEEEENKSKRTKKEKEVEGYSRHRGCDVNALSCPSG